MKFVAATLLAVSFLLALVFGAQTAEWSWGPALVALALACGAAAFIKSDRGGLGVGIALLPAAGWILYRGVTSDVADFARADALLLLAVLATATVVAGLRPGARSVPALFAGLAMVSILNLAVGVIQSQSPEFMWPYHHRPTDRVTGFFGHYNYFSCFTYTVGLLLAARGFFAKDHVALRFLFVATALWSSVMVPVSGSRGGTVAMAVGVVVLVACAGVLAWRQGAWWSKVFLILFPLLLVGSAIAGWWMLSKVQEKRATPGQATNSVLLLDNAARLEWVDLALQVGMDHPVAGGGSRSYSWERNRRWDVEEFGQGAENERFVHNELLQLFTDYGAAGVVLVLIPIGWVGWLGFSRLFLGEIGGGGHLDAVAIGVLSAGAAMLTQANFSFIFHLLPSTLLLGLLLGLGALLSPSKDATCASRSARWVVGGLLACGIAWFGVQGTRSLRLVWPVMYGETSLIHSDPEAAAERLERAATMWPGHRMWEEAGHACRVAAAGTESPAAREAWNRRAVANYRAAMPLHPHHPGLALNLANALSELGENELAEQAYLESIELQGGLEAAFRARYYHAKHLYEMWYRRWTDPDERRSGEALWAFRECLALLDESKEQAPWRNEERLALRRQVEEAIAFLEGARVRPVVPDGAISE